MIDIDDVGDSFIFGGIIVGIFFLVCYLTFSKPVIEECEAKGGIIVKSNGEAKCIDKKSIIEVRP